MNGIINVLKPPSMGSHGVTVYLRKLLNEKKIGHAGTLDPMAGGVLICLLGRSTKLSDYLMAEDKTYIAEIAFGKKTDTLDSEGEIISTDERKVEKEELLRAISKFTGLIEQVPPAYSAIKVGGRKAYELARKGEEVNLKKRQVKIHSITVLEQTGDNRFLLEIKCEKGTYIRTLLLDIAESLGTVAYTSFLLRTKSGSFDIEKSFTLDEVAAMAEKNDYSFLSSPKDVLLGYEEIILDEKDAFRIKNGVEVSSQGREDGLYLVSTEEGFLGIGQCAEEKIKLKVSLY